MTTIRSNLREGWTDWLGGGGGLCTLIETRRAFLSTAARVAWLLRTERPTCTSKAGGEVSWCARSDTSNDKVHGKAITIADIVSVGHSMGLKMRLCEDNQPEGAIARDDWAGYRAFLQPVYRLRHRPDAVVIIFYFRSKAKAVSMKPHRRTHAGSLLRFSPCSFPLLGPFPVVPACLCMTLMWWCGVALLHAFEVCLRHDLPCSGHSGTHLCNKRPTPHCTEAVRGVLQCTGVNDSTALRKICVKVNSGGS